MPRHNVYFSLPKRELGKSDIIIEVFGDDDRMGKVTISKGAIEWYPANAKNHIKWNGRNSTGPSVLIIMIFEIIVQSS
jgi:hypothetical protein